MTKIQLPLGFFAKMNEESTQIVNGVIKVRVDLFPPENSKIYPAYNGNFCLGHFFSIDPDMTEAEIEQKVIEIFDENTLLVLENNLSKTGGSGISAVSFDMNSPKKRGEHIEVRKIEADRSAETIKRFNDNFKNKYK